MLSTCNGVESQQQVWKGKSGHEKVFWTEWMGLSEWILGVRMIATGWENKWRVGSRWWTRGERTRDRLQAGTVFAGEDQRTPI